MSDILRTTSDCQYRENGSNGRNGSVLFDSMLIFHSTARPLQPSVPRYSIFTTTSPFRVFFLDHIAFLTTHLFHIHFSTALLYLKIYFAHWGQPSHPSQMLVNGLPLNSEHEVSTKLAWTVMANECFSLMSGVDFYFVLEYFKDLANVNK